MTSSQTPPSKRVFFAFQLEPSVVESLHDCVTRLNKASQFTPVRMRFVPPENYHLTLHFLGSIEQPQVNALEDFLKNSTMPIPSFTIDVTGLGYFPNPKSPKVLWAGVSKGSDQIKLLYDYLAGELTERGVILQHTNFHAHITLARFSALKGTHAFTKLAKDFEKKFFGQSTVKSIHLMESLFQDGQVSYRSLAESKLSGT